MLHRFLRSRSGNVAIISTLLMPVIVGFCALAAETSFWYYRHRSVQDMADFAAQNAAITLARGGAETDVAAAAKADAIANGWQEDSGTIEVTQHGPFLEVVLTENQTRYFTRFFCNAPITIGARAVAFGPRGGRAKLVWVEEDPNSPGNMSTGCRYQTEPVSKEPPKAVRAKTERRK